MDAYDFDRLVQSLPATGSRRGVLGRLAALPFLGVLFAVFDPDDADAQGRRKRRKKAHKHGKGRGNGEHKKQKHQKEKRKKRCTPQAKSTTCADTCGTVQNNCKQTVDCGPCLCEGGCPACQICDEETRSCVADPSQAGGACGDEGQVCQADGSCACDATSCGPCATCQGDGSCAPIVDGTCCPEGVCVAGVCETRATLEMCGGRCSVDDLPATFQCTGGGDPVPCPACDGGCAASGCDDGGMHLMTPEGVEIYCITGNSRTNSCQACFNSPTPVFCAPDCQTPGELCEACPAGEGCFITDCLEICTGT